jgi:flagellar basal-body rod modification protein FlgD
MNINTSYQAHAADPTAPSTNSSSSSSSTDDMFMQLLITQLKNQSPLNPVDPNQFVNQLVQFNTLNEVIGIHQLLQQFTSAAPSSDPSAQGGQ